MTHDESKKSAGGMAGSAIAGALIGAAAVALLHKPTRDKVKKAFVEARQTGEEKLNQAKDKIGELQEEGKGKIYEALGQAQDKLEGTESKAQKTLSRAKRKTNEI